MRLLLAVDSAVWGGAEAWLGHLLHELPDRFACTVLATDPVPDRLVDAARARGRLEVVAGVRDKRDLRHLYALDRAVARARPDVVHVNQSHPTNNRHLLALAVTRRIPTVAALHLWGASPRSGVQARVLRSSYRRTAAVAVVSRDIGAMVVREMGVDPARVHLVRNRVAALPPAPRRTGPGPLVIGALGRLVDQKGFDVLVSAVASLHEQGRELQVLVAGEGPDRERLQAQADGLPVRFVGAVDDGAAFLSTVDAFVLPSRDEGLPLALLEAMTLGLPCVVTDVGDVREAVGACALVVPPDDAPALVAAVSTLLDSRQLRERLGDGARRHVLEQGSAHDMAGAMAAVFDSVHASRGAR